MRTQISICSIRSIEMWSSWPQFSLFRFDGGVELFLIKITFRHRYDTGHDRRQIALTLVTF